MKRFYKAVSVKQIKDGWAVLLDGKTIKTPNGKTLCLYNRKTAELIACEWDSVGVNDKINPKSMDYTSLASTALDKIIPNMTEVKTNLCSYAMNELICYREQHNQKLIKMQNQHWNGELEWATTELNMPLQTTMAITPLQQDNTVYCSAMAICDSMTGFELTVFADFVTNLGSFVLSCAVVRGRLNIDNAWYKANLDEYFQNIQWGEDIERKNILEMTKKSLQKTLNFNNSLKK